MKLYLLGIAFILSGIGFGIPNVFINIGDWAAIILTFIGIVLIIVGVCGKYKKIDISKMKTFFLGIALILFGYVLFAISDSTYFIFVSAIVVTVIGFLLSVIGAVIEEKQPE